MVSLCQFSPAPNDMFVQNELKLFHIDRLTRLYAIQKLSRRRKILERIQDLISHFCLQEDGQPVMQVFFANN